MHSGGGDGDTSALGGGFQANGADAILPRSKAKRKGYVNLGESEQDDDEDTAVAGATTTSRVKRDYVGVGKGEDDEAAEDEHEGDGEADKVSGRLAIFGFLNLVYVVFQLAGSMAFGSLALLSDGFHNLSDV